MLVAEVADVGHGGKVLPYELTQNARACSVQNAYARHANEDGIVDEVGDGIDGLVATYATDIKVLAEVLFTVVDDVARVVRDAAVGAHDVGVACLGLCLLGFRRFGVFQTLGAHLGLHAAEDDCSHLAVDALNGAYALQPLDAHGVADFEL